MNPFINHPHQQGVTYTEHMIFAMGIALRLLSTVIAFAAHAVFPFIDICRSLDLEATADFINERNEWIESAGRVNDTSVRRNSEFVGQYTCLK